MPFERRFIFYEDGEEEGADSGTDTSTPDDATETDNSGEAETSEDNTGTDETEPQEDNQSETNSEDEDYDIDTEPDPDPGGDEEGTDSGDSPDDSELNDNSGEDDSTDNEEKALDRELFDSLSDSEKERKISTLKGLYKDLYGKCTTLIEKFNQLTEEENDDFKPAVKRILTILYDLKEFISYYLLKVYDKTSYIENDINFNRYLSILNGIKLTVLELEKIKKKEQDK